MSHTPLLHGNYSLSWKCKQYDCIARAISQRVNWLDAIFISANAFLDTLKIVDYKERIMTEITLLVVG
jgi:hypothetical protein